MRKRRILLFGIVFCLVLVAPALALSLQVIDIEGQTTTLTALEVLNMPHTTVKVIDHDVPAQFEGIPLANVLASAKIQLGDTLRGQRMTEVPVVEAADSYRVAFALAELDPAFAARDIVLADERDGKPLDAKQGPLRVVAAGDKRPHVGCVR